MNDDYCWISYVLVSWRLTVVSFAAQKSAASNQMPPPPPPPPPPRYVI